MYIRGLIPRNFAEMTEAVPIAVAPDVTRLSRSQGALGRASCGYTVYSMHFSVLFKGCTLLRLRNLKCFILGVHVFCLGGGGYLNKW